MTRSLCGAPRRIRTFDLPVRSRALYPLSYGRKNGASDGNRTHATSLEGWNSTIELHSHMLYSSYYIIPQNFTFVNTFLKLFSVYFFGFRSRVFISASKYFFNYFTTMLMIFPGTIISLAIVFPSIAAAIFSSALTRARISSLDAAVGIIRTERTLPFI